MHSRLKVTQCKQLILKEMDIYVKFALLIFLSKFRLDFSHACKGNVLLVL